MCSSDLKGVHESIRFIFSEADSIAAARLALMFKEGSFNPYGNGQTSGVTNINVFAPNFRTLPDGIYEVYSTVMVGNTAPRAVFGRGGSPLEAFADWLSSVSNLFQIFSPTNPLANFIEQLRTVPSPDTNHPLHYLWVDDNALHTFSMLVEGTFNPYGNGQPPLSQKAYLARNKLAFDAAKLSTAARISRYNQYKARFNANDLGSKATSSNKVSATSVETRAMIRSQIGAMAAARTNAALKTRDSLSGITECSKGYFAALTCPFYWVDKACESSLKELKLPEDVENPCIPLPPNTKSRKFYAYTRGSFACTALGTAAGSGYIVFAPCRIANFSPNDMQSPCIITNNSTLVSVSPPVFPGTIDTTVAATPNNNIASLNSEYGNVDLVAVGNRALRYRVVGAGLRVRYTGTEINRAGTLHCIVHPNHDTLAGMSENDIGQYETYFRMPVTRKWVTLSHTPVLESDFQFSPDYPSNPALFSSFLMNNEKQLHYIGFLPTDCPLGTFEYEAIVHFEAVGSNVRGLTSTPVDMPGVSVVLNSTTPQNMAQINSTSNIGSLLKDGLDLVSRVVPEAKILSDVVGLGTEIYNKLK